MAYTTRLTWEQLRSINSATLTGSFQPVGGPLLYESYIFKMVNNSTSLVTVSWDGVNAYDVLPAGSFFLYDCDTSGIPTPEGFPAGTQIFVSGSAGTGLIYVVSVYVVQTIS